MSPTDVADLPSIGHDFPDTRFTVWCPGCGGDGYYSVFPRQERRHALENKRVPGTARCLTPPQICRVDTFVTGA